MINISTFITFSYIKIYFNNGLLFACKKDEFIGMQAWVDGGNKWIIEMYTTHNSILMEFDTKEKWEAVLTAIDTKIIQ